MRRPLVIGVAGATVGATRAVVAVGIPVLADRVPGDRLDARVAAP